MADVKCYVCKEKYDKSLMKVEEKETGKFNKDGSPRITRRYFHRDCYEKFIKDKEIKQLELKELDELYRYLLKIHEIEVLCSRMIEKIQDLRNGSVKLKGEKIKRYKEGIKYSVMLLSYKQQEENITRVLRTKSFETKWNEFSYCFGIMLKTVNDVNVADKLKQKHEIKSANYNKYDDYQEINVENKSGKKKDELDISKFL